MSKSAISNDSRSDEAAGPLDPVGKSPKIVINAVTTKAEFSRLLANTGVLDLFADIIRELYETDESEWPDHADEYLLLKFIQRVPIAKQIHLMASNFQKRIAELEDEMEDAVAEKEAAYLRHRETVLLDMLDQGSETSLDDNEVQEKPAAVSDAGSKQPLRNLTNQKEDSKNFETISENRENPPNSALALDTKQEENYLEKDQN